LNEGPEDTHFSEHSLVGSYELGGGRVFLRITNSSHKQFEKVLGEVQWAYFLGNKGLSVSRPLPSAEGNLAERIIVDDCSFTAVCYEEAKGRPAGESDYNDALFKRIGIFMGKMHDITKQYIHPDPVTRRPDWSVEADKILSIDLPKSESDILERYTALRGYIFELPKSEDSYGLIHADFHYGNFYINGDSICLYDFDASRYSWFVDDIAIALFFATPIADLGLHSYMDRFLPSLMEGYRTENTLEENWLREIPYFVKLREMGRYIKLFHACGGEFEKLHPWGQAFMKDRKDRIINSFPAI
jgi:Ser/Thr protein kinase RdoA (MazF antagonist)